MRNRRLLALLAGFCTSAVPLHGQRTVEDPLTLFAKMMPVLSHDRCVNCHGATNAFRGEYHPGAVSQSTPCVNCHTANPKWDVAPPVFAFFKKTTRELCHHFEALGASESNALHLERDDLIGLAFVGRRGNAVTAEYTQKPPMTRAEFVAAYRAWVRDGGGICSAWEGTITRTETVAGDSTGPSALDVRQFGPMKVTSWQRGTHSYTITIKDGKATVSTTLDGEINHKEVTTTSNCELTAHIRDAYSLVSTSAAANATAGPAGRGATGPLVATGDGTVRVGLAADGAYRIHIVPPAEKTQKTSTTTITATCPIPNAAPPAHTDTFDWDPWVFEIVGKLPDPRVRTHLEGQTVEMLDSMADPPFGLAGSADVGRLNEKRVKFRVTTTWDLRRAP